MRVPLNEENEVRMGGLKEIVMECDGADFKERRVLLKERKGAIYWLVRFFELQEESGDGRCYFLFFILKEVKFC